MTLNVQNAQIFAIIAKISLFSIKINLPLLFRTILLEKDPRYDKDGLVFGAILPFTVLIIVSEVIECSAILR